MAQSEDPDPKKACVWQTSRAPTGGFRKKGHQLCRPLKHSTMQRAKRKLPLVSAVVELRGQRRRAHFHDFCCCSSTSVERMIATKEKEGKGVPRGLLPTGNGIHDWQPYLTKQVVL